MTRKEKQELMLRVARRKWEALTQKEKESIDTNYCCEIPEKDARSIALYGVGVCEECGNAVDMNYIAISGCSFAVKRCQTCFYGHCDHDCWI